MRTLVVALILSSWSLSALAGREEGQADLASVASSHSVKYYEQTAWTGDSISTGNRSHVIELVEVLTREEGCPARSRNCGRVKSAQGDQSIK